MSLLRYSLMLTRSGVGNRALHNSSYLLFEDIIPHPTEQKKKVALKVDSNTDNLSEFDAGTTNEQRITRRVRIYKPAARSTQSGTHNTRLWRIEFDQRERWENPLMGWASNADPLSNLHVEFSSAEDAIRYCERQGWRFVVDEARDSRIPPKSYAANFSWNRKTRLSTK